MKAIYRSVFVAGFVAGKGIPLSRVSGRDQAQGDNRFEEWYRAYIAENREAWEKRGVKCDEG